MPTGIRMNKRNRLKILKGARAILANRSRWTTKAVRRKDSQGNDRAFCLIGACAQAATEAGLGSEKSLFHNRQAYILAEELGLDEFAIKRHQMLAFGVNDVLGYTTALQLLDDLIIENKAVKPRG